MIPLLLAASLSAEPLVSADLVLLDAKVWTGDAAKPDVEALAISKGRVLKVGSTIDVKALAGPKTIVVDGKGRRVLPGFIDSHVHFLGGGLQLARVELKDCKDAAEFAARLKAFHDNTSRSRWMLGGNWDHDRAFDGKLPTAETIDAVAKDRPVFLRRYDGHMALANSAALKLANITAETKDPAGGVIGRLADGKTPSGILKDNAMELVARIVPEPSDEEIAEAVRAALAACAAKGVTAVHDMDGSSRATRLKLLRILQRLDKAGELTVRIDLRWPIAEQKDLSSLGLEAGFGSEFLRIGGLKGYMDGSLGSSTAKMAEPYSGEGEKNTGVFVTEPDAMLAMVKKADADRLAVAVHAIGDEANAKLLDLFAAAAKANGVRDRRFRIEHAQHLRPVDIPRFKALGVVASMQPYHVVDDGRWAEGRIGAKRCESSYAYRDLLDAGAVLAFGSDWPVAPLDVLAGIDAAVNRRPLDGKHPKGWFPKQRITVAEAIAAYTAGSAFAGHREEQLGKLAPGYAADFVILDRDPLAEMERETLGSITVTQTFVAGKPVMAAK